MHITEGLRRRKTSFMNINYVIWRRTSHDSLIFITRPSPLKERQRNGSNINELRLRSLSQFWLLFYFSVWQELFRWVVCPWATLPRLTQAQNDCEEARAVFSSRFCLKCRGQTAECRVDFGGWFRLEWCGLPRLWDPDSSSGPPVRARGSAGELLRPAAVHSVPEPADDRPLPGQNTPGVPGCHNKTRPCLKIGKMHVFCRGSPGIIRIPGVKYRVIVVALPRGHEKQAAATL